MRLPLPENLIALSENCSFPLYVVGGFVRNFLSGFEALGDVDICAPVSADEFIKCATAAGALVTAVYKHTGTVKIKWDGQETEFASFRSDKYIRGEHTPAETFFTDDIYLDARRRDFKCNAVYYDIKNGNFCDPLGGMADIKNKVISTVTDSDKVFSEDGLRLMRLARQAAQLGFEPSKECLEGAYKNRTKICDVSAERIYAELCLILQADEKYGVKYAQYTGLKILEKTGVLNVILPELTAGRGMAQNSAFHSHDVLEHSLRCVKYADKSIRLASLLHDIGKPYAMNAQGNFYGHEVCGAEIAKSVCSRFKVSKRDTEEVEKLTALHMYDTRLDARENKIKKLIVKNLNIFDKLLLLKQADYSACKDDLSVAPCVVKWKNIYNKMIEQGVPLSLKQLNIKGDEIIALGVPKQNTSKILEELLINCVSGSVKNDRQKLISYVQKVYIKNNY